MACICHVRSRNSFQKIRNRYVGNNEWNFTFSIFFASVLYFVVFLFSIPVPDIGEPSEQYLTKEIIIEMFTW